MEYLINGSLYTMNNNNLMLNSLKRIRKTGFRISLRACKNKTHHVYNVIIIVRLADIPLGEGTSIIIILLLQLYKYQIKSFMGKYGPAVCNWN